MQTFYEIYFMLRSLDLCNVKHQQGKLFIRMLTFSDVIDQVLLGKIVCNNGKNVEEKMYEI